MIIKEMLTMNYNLNKLRNNSRMWRGPGAMVEAESELAGSNPTLAFKFQRNKMSLPRSRTVTKW